jgi:hypothetical protein
MFARHIRQARLLDMAVSHVSHASCDIIPPLFDLQLVKMTNTLMTSHGYQIHVNAETGVIRQYVPCWILRQAITSSCPLWFSDIYQNYYTATVQD